MTIDKNCFPGLSHYLKVVGRVMRSLAVVSAGAANDRGRVEDY